MRFHTIIVAFAITYQVHGLTIPTHVGKQATSQHVPLDRLSVTTAEITIEVDNGTHHLDHLTHPFPVDQQSLQPVKSTLHKHQTRALKIPHWMKRLDTKHDAMRLKKISGAFNLLSGFTIVGSAISTGMSTVPEWLQPIDFIFLTSSLLLLGISARMTLIHRSHQPEMQNAMFGNVIMAATSIVASEWVAPWYPDSLCGYNISVSFLSVCAFAILINTYKGFLTGAGLVDNRTDKKRQDPFLLDWAGYVAPIGVGSVAAIIFFVLGAEYSRSEYLEYLSTTDIGMEKGFAMNYYETNFIGICTMYMPFLATLRDRKLIPKVWERNGIFVLTFIIMIFGTGILQTMPPLDPVHAFDAIKAHVAI